MTEKLYNYDGQLREFEATVLSCEPDGKCYQVVLDRTAFFPEGGGQFGDVGMIGDARVVDTQEKKDVIYHKTESALVPGTQVKCNIDWKVRFDRMQQHSGEHIMSGLVHQRFGFDNVGFHLGEEETTLDFNGVIPAEALAQIEWDANLAIAEDFPVLIKYPTKEELADMKYRSKIEIEGQVRIVEYPGYDICACCAPHVARTGQIGMIKIVHVQNWKGGIRVTILCGMRALQDYRNKDASVKAISNMLSAKENMVPDTVEKLKNQNNEMRLQMLGFQRQMLHKELERFPVGSTNPVVFVDEIDNNILREFVNDLTERCTGYAAAFMGNDEKGYRYIAASRNEDVREVGKLLNARCHGRGGGKPDMIQGSVQAARVEIEAVLAEAGA